MREQRPPKGVASFMGLEWSSTAWAMLKRSTAFSARRGRALQPVALSVAREKAVSTASKRSQEKITNQARRDWEEVVGRGAPKKMVEVAEEASAVAAGADPTMEERVGHAEKGDPRGPLPCASALGAPLPAAALLKLNKGREVNPGQKALLSQGGQAGGVPAVPLAQPRQVALVARAAASEVELANAAGRRGRGQARGAQSAREEVVAIMGCLPAGQEKASAHCVSCVAPVEKVVLPAGQPVHCSSEVALGSLRNVPRGHRVGEMAPVPPPGGGALKDPGGEGVQVVEPARGA